MVLIDKIKTNSTLLLAVRIVLLIGSFYYLYNEFENRNASAQIILLTEQISTNGLWVFFILCIGLSFLNWFIEAHKWRRILRKDYLMNYVKAYKAILASLSMSVFTPNRLGEYGVRILTVPPALRRKALASLLVCNISQLSSTLLFGFIGVFVLGGFYTAQVNVILRYTIAFIGIVATLIAYVKLPLILGFLSKWRMFSYFKRVLRIVKKVDVATLREQLGLSLLRYVVFVSQQSFFFILAGLEISYTQAFFTTALFHLAMMGIPTIIWLDVIVKGSVALSLFSLYTDQAEIILAVVFFMWFLNIAMPAIIGSLFVFNRKKTNTNA